MNYPINVFQIETEDGYVWMGKFPDVKGCVGGGNTPEEAIKDAYANLEIFLAYLNKSNLPIPTPTNNDVEETYSGKMSYRTSKKTHRALAKLAEKEGVSINSIINEAVIERVTIKSCENIVEKNFSNIISEFNHYRKSAIWQTYYNAGKITYSANLYDSNRKFNKCSQGANNYGKN